MQPYFTREEGNAGSTPKDGYEPAGELSDYLYKDGYFFRLLAILYYELIVFRFLTGYRYRNSFTKKRFLLFSSEKGGYSP